VRRLTVAVTAALLLILAGCSTGRPSPAPTVTATEDGHHCPSVGQAIDRYLAQLKTGVKEPELSFAGCTPDQMRQRIADMQLVAPETSQ
jgi:hypothetical protein